MKKHIQHSVSLALAEDLNNQSPKTGDVTANLIPEDHVCTARVITREDCVIAGTDWVQETFNQVDQSLTLTMLCEDGKSVPADTVLFEVSGKAKSILTAERTALNFLQTLSATATLTAACVKELEGSQTKLLDTRKTLPGLRLAQKYAVTCGGGQNHRVGLYDAFLIKENHILACGGIEKAITTAKTQHPNLPVEVEVESITELQQAIDAEADIVMLDNFSIEQIQQAVALNQRRLKLEVSGNITKERLRELANLGVDFISSGALTKHIQAVDLSLRIV